MTDLGFVRPPTLTSMVAGSIREAVLRGDLCQGKRLQEAQLSTEYNVSRGTVREALRSLQMEGLIRIVPHRGAVVDTLTPRKVEETYSLRSILESHAVELAITRGNYGSRILAELRDLLSHMGNVRKTGTSAEIVAIDAQFHQHLCAPSDHGMLLEVLEIAIARTRLCMVALAIKGSTILADPSKHESIMTSVKEGDVAGAHIALEEHFRLGRDELLARMSIEATDETG